MLRIIKLCMLPAENKATKATFPTYFGYKVDQDAEGNFNTREYPTVVTKEDGTTETIMKAKSFKVKPSDEIINAIKADGDNFPYLITYDDEVLDEEGKKVNYNKVDKKNGKPRLDKYGRRHAIVVINKAVEIKACPKINISFDDIENFE